MFQSCAQVQDLKHKCDNVLEMIHVGWNRSGLRWHRQEGVPSFFDCLLSQPSCFLYSETTWKY